MYALDYEELILAAAENVPLFPGLLADEIEYGSFDLLPRHEELEIVIEALYIEGVYVLEIELAVFIARAEAAVAVIVVKRDHYGVEPLRAELSRYAVRGGGLAGGGRPRYHDSPCAALDYRVGGAGVHLFMERLVYPYELAHRAVFDPRIQFVRGGAGHELAPIVGALEHRGHFGIRHEGRGTIGRFPCGAHHHEPAF